MTSPRRPPGRYDERAPLPRSVLATLATVLGLGLLALTYLAWDRFQPHRPTFAVDGYHVLTDHAVEVGFTVRFGSGGRQPVHCTLQARDRDGAVVGSGVVTVSRDSPSATLTLATTRRAATGEVLSCSP